VKNLIKSIFFGNIRVNRVVDKISLEHFFQKINIVHYENGLIRIGGDFDGG
jgi:hypothetical protein